MKSVALCLELLKSENGFFSVFSGVKNKLQSTIIDTEGRIDVPVSNAGFGSYGAVEDVPLSDAHYQLEVNVFGAARLIQLVLPHLRKKQHGKNCKQIFYGKMATPFGGWYHASKFALEG